MATACPCFAGGALRIALCNASEPKIPYLNVRYMMIDQLRHIQIGQGLMDAKNVLMYFEICAMAILAHNVPEMPDEIQSQSAADWDAFRELLHYDRYEGGIPEDVNGANALANKRSAAFFDLCEKYNIFLMC